MDMGMMKGFLPLSKLREGTTEADYVVGQTLVCAVDERWQANMFYLDILVVKITASWKTVDVVMIN